MIASGLYKSTDDPPDVPAFHQGDPKQKKESWTGPLTGAVEAFARAIGNTLKSQQVVESEQVINASDMPIKVGISPAKAAELRMRNLEQLRYLQGLYDDNILSDKELAEQKCIILDALRKLS